MRVVPRQSTHVARVRCIASPRCSTKDAGEDPGRHMVPSQMSSASSTDARMLAAEMKRQLQQYRAEHIQLEASMRWRLERELEAKAAPNTQTWWRE